MLDMVTVSCKDEALFFDFVFNYTDELDERPYQRVVNGEWVRRYGGGIAVTNAR